MDGSTTQEQQGYKLLKRYFFVIFNLIFFYFKLVYIYKEKKKHRLKNIIGII